MENLPPNNTDTADTRPETLLVATVVLDEIALRVSNIHDSAELLRTWARGAAYSGVPSPSDSASVAQNAEDEAGAVLRLLETLGADLPRPAPQSRETLAREARIRRDPRLWAETMVHLKTALPHGIAPEPSDRDKDP